MAKRGFVFSQFCVLCARPDEAADVLDIFEKKFKREPRGDRFGDNVFIVPGADNDRRVMVSSCERMGHVDAAARTAQIVARNRPGLIIFVGTAASLKPGKIQVGDVVVPQKSVYRRYEKISEKGQADYESRVKRENFREKFFDDNALITETDAVQMTGDENNIVAELKRSSRNVSLECGTGSEIAIDGQRYKLREPRVHVDVDILSCGMVVDSITYRDFLVERSDDIVRKTDVIDMESYGFFKALQLTKDIYTCKGLMVRGISDYAGRKQQLEAGLEGRPEGWKETGVRNAALVVAELLASLTAASVFPMSELSD